MKEIPHVKDFMSKAIYAINSESTLAEAENVMKKYNVRHLPVVLGPKAYGILSDRDLKYFSSLTAVDFTSTRVRDFCEENPYITGPETRLGDVSAELAERRVGSALIVDNDQLVGIFTTTDACRALADLCRQI